MTARRARKSGVVYSTDHGRMCPSCGEPSDRCTCRARPSTPAGDGIVRVARSTKGRKGKGVTVITGLPLDANELRELAKRLKQKCGSGGAVKDGAIEIQGEHRDRLASELEKQGYTVRRSGG